MTTFALPSVPALPRVGFGRLAKAAKAARNERMAARSLNHLDAHLLRDIGLTPPVTDTHMVLFRAFVGR